MTLVMTSDLHAHAYTCAYMHLHTQTCIHPHTKGNVCHPELDAVAIFILQQGNGIEREGPPTVRISKW